MASTSIQQRTPLINLAGNRIDFVEQIAPSISVLDVKKKAAAATAAETKDLDLSPEDTVIVQRRFQVMDGDRVMEDDELLPWS